MQSMTPRSGARLFARLLMAGQRVDWRYSFVVALVITGMFSTPLALGSIRNRVYLAVKEQIEKENNAREITLELAREAGPALDETLIQRIESDHPGLDAVGNRKLVVTVEGPVGTDFLTLQTLAPGDPRGAPLGIEPAIPRTFGPGQVILSDSLGRRLYGDGWDESWSEEGRFAGEPIAMAINELPVAAEFSVVARRTLPGVAVYVSNETGAALRQFTLGFGAPELGLPIDEGLVAAALPELATDRCRILLADADPECGEADRATLERRLLASQHLVYRAPERDLPPLAGHEEWSVVLRETVEQGGRSLLRARRGQCRENLQAHFVDRCGQARILDELHLRVTGWALRSQKTEESFEADLVALGPDHLPLLEGWEELRDQLGVPLENRAEIRAAVPEGFGLLPSQAAWVEIGGVRVQLRVDSLYRCHDLAPCPWMLAPADLFRLQSLRDGTVRIASHEPLVFVPTDTGNQYDQLLAYVPEVEQVPQIAEALQATYPDLNVQYNSTALDKLRRQDSRLSALFSLTMALSALFLVLALSALAQINLERRSRQMAQMLILGFRRRFVRRLVVAEYLLLTVVSALSSFLLTAALFTGARMLLRSSSSGNGSKDFAVIVDSMTVDPRAFLLVFAGVLVLTSLIAATSARQAARANPLTLLD